jgi:hypothetical protein
MSPTMHWRDTINKIIQDEATTKALGIEIRLVPRTIPYGQGDNKTAAMTVEILTDRTKVNMVREFLIELFDTKRDAIPSSIFFVPSPAQGTMTYDLYYDLLRVHHVYTANLRSFAITNVRDLNATLTIPTDDQGNTKQLSFIDGLLMAEHEDGNKLFVSIEPTNRTEKDGRYLVITTKEYLADAQTWFDTNVDHIANATPANMVRITRDDTSTVARTNRIATSNRFQTYAASLQSLIPDTITMTTPPPNAWKRRPPANLNLTDDTFPALDSTKKQRTNDTVNTEATTTTDTLITVDLDDIDEKREALRSEMQKEMTSLRQEMTNIRKELREDFMTQVGKMELRIEKNMKPMMTDFHARVEILTVNIQAVADSVTAHADVNDAKFDRILEAIESLGKRSLPTPDGTPIRNADKKPRAINTNTATHDPMTIDFDNYETDGSLKQNPTASRAITPTTGTRAPAGAPK